ncbi:hypothetical protein [Puniceibacterium confluentis]|uniref:hypothetical protein n=1 Tax=Puniceibacterium confluentis TaxID=1958944 RepID=UPI001C9431F5|nr:hypothetical protein [Puniceibacterium confluentis]
MLNEYRIAVFKIIPLIIAVYALAIPYLESPLWRASLITNIVMMAVILVIDINVNARPNAYREQLVLTERSMLFPM